MEKITQITFALFRKRPKPLKDELVGYESWSKTFRWGYSLPDTLGARPWNGHYINHDYKIKVNNL
jgi:hypothetical protein